jgi:hypothetical protein
MSEETIDLKSLQSRINEIKKEGQESADFTIEYIECLMKRHDLKDSIPDDYELEEVPDSVIDCLRKGEIPTKEQIILMDSDIQNYFLFEMIWLCGMTAISYYTSDEELEDGENGTFDIILGMMNISSGHWTACYLICVLSLLMARVPSEDMISTFTNNFSDDEEQIQRNMNYFIEFAASVLFRYTEDKIYMKDV